MDRLTYRTGSDQLCLQCDANTRAPITSWSTPAQNAITKLAAYEDAGLTPERCAELAKAEQEGRLVELPKEYCIGTIRSMLALSKRLNVIMRKRAKTLSL